MSEAVLPQVLNSLAGGGDSMSLNNGSGCLRFYSLDRHPWFQRGLSRGVQGESVSMCTSIPAHEGHAMSPEYS